MVFRLPTPLDNVSAPPGHGGGGGGRERRSRPWKGHFVLQGANLGAYGFTDNNTRIAVAAAETEGDK